jgi:amidophosphoribosyltransferase
VSPEIYEGLLMLQHRGQDSAGMVTWDGTNFGEHKDNGLVKDVFDAKTTKSLKGETSSSLSLAVLNPKPS